MIRPARDADRAAIAALQIASWTDTYRGMLPDTYIDGPMAADLQAKWATRRMGQGLWAWVAEGEESDIVGFAACAGDTDPVLLDNLHVSPPHRSQGWGAKLLWAARLGMAERGRPNLYLTVLASNPKARAFYLREGGALSGPIEDQIFDLPVAAYRLDWGPPSADGSSQPL